MDVDITDILAEAGRGDASSARVVGDAYDVDSAYTDHVLLTRAWTAERCTPALLTYPSALVERVMQRVRAQIAHIEDLAAGIGDAGYVTATAAANSNHPNNHANATKSPASNQNLNLILSILQTDLSRTQFLIRSLLRQRLAKISKFAQYYVQQVDHDGGEPPSDDGDDSAPGRGGLLSPAEARFLRHHQALLLGFYESTFMAGFPPNLRRLDDSSGGVAMVEGPDVDAAVVVRCLAAEWSNEADVDEANRSGGDNDDEDRPVTELRMLQGDIMIVRWRDVSRAVTRGQLELL